MKIAVFNKNTTLWKEHILEYYWSGQYWYVRVIYNKIRKDRSKVVGSGKTKHDAFVDFIALYNAK